MNIRLKPEEAIVVFEAARIALNDSDIFDKIADQMDIADSDLAEIRDKLEKQMQQS